MVINDLLFADCLSRSQLSCSLTGTPQTGNIPPLNRSLVNLFFFAHAPHHHYHKLISPFTIISLVVHLYSSHTHLYSPHSQLDFPYTQLESSKTWLDSSHEQLDSPNMQ